MIYKYLISVCLLLLFILPSFGQSGQIEGQVYDGEEPIPFASVSIRESGKGTITNESGRFTLEDLPIGKYMLDVSRIGYLSQEMEVVLEQGALDVDLKISLKPISTLLDQVVVTGTRTDKRQTDSPVIVQVLSSENLTDVQACNISEGLRFQPGLRVETDCQTCNYTQLRMNGLGGGYSQILINGRPVFSPLTGLYGLEQIPANMVERIEVVRGGGSALYGSSSIGGTVNVITRIPEAASYDLSFTNQWINGQINDQIISGNVALMAPSEKVGAALFVNRRRRRMYDHNGDNFSELPELQNNSFGVKLFYQPGRNEKLEVNFSSLHEYRYGGEMVEGPAHLASQSEERTHNVLMGGLDYQVNFNKDNSSFIFYSGFQHTDRDHYTGIFPDSATAIQDHLVEPPYGKTNNYTLQAGTQLNHRFSNWVGTPVFTTGIEYVLDDVVDSIPAYQYLIDQQTRNLGAFLQTDWSFGNLQLLAGVRADKHNLVDGLIASPRVSVLWKFIPDAQFRLSWGTGFRAPQAFDADLHIAFAGGGISRISLSPDLNPERSNSLSTSLNYDKGGEHFIAGFTLEGFYTDLKKAFYLAPIGMDAFGERFEKRNGPGAEVYGLTLETRANYDQKVQLEAGYTWQRSLYKEAVEVIDGVPALRNFLRSPDQYGYLTLTWFGSKRLRSSLNAVYTGPMWLAHFAGAPEQTNDELLRSDSFVELGWRMSYTIPLKQAESGLEFFGGVKNIFNAYQNDFDSGKNRDSNYVYGPAAPRTFFLGLRFRSM
ncbi:MAG: TonB-dependent receptor [Bacteroidetes bacterium]|nr:TonB-dependent receptor [Bacteroidota bacterium]